MNSSRNKISVQPLNKHNTKEGTSMSRCMRRRVQRGAQPVARWGFSASPRFPLLTDSPMAGMLSWAIPSSCRSTRRISDRSYPTSSARSSSNRDPAVSATGGNSGRGPGAAVFVSGASVAPRSFRALTMMADGGGEGTGSSSSSGGRGRCCQWDRDGRAMRVRHNKQRSSIIRSI